MTIPESQTISDTDFKQVMALHAFQRNRDNSAIFFLEYQRNFHYSGWSLYLPKPNLRSEIREAAFSIQIEVHRAITVDLFYEEKVCIDRLILGSNQGQTHSKIRSRHLHMIYFIHKLGLDVRQHGNKVNKSGSNDTGVIMQSFSPLRQQFKQWHRCRWILYLILGFWMNQNMLDRKNDIKYWIMDWQVITATGQQVWKVRKF